MATTHGLTPRSKPSRDPQRQDGQVVLVLQGGGALGAYQGGVYQALHEAGIEPDWIIGTSIGAINASLIAGNELEDRLAEAAGVLAADGAQRRLWALSRPGPASPTRCPTGRRSPSGIPGFFETNPPRLSRRRMCRSAPTTPASTRPSRCARR